MRFDAEVQVFLDVYENDDEEETEEEARMSLPRKE